MTTHATDPAGTTTPSLRHQRRYLTWLVSDTSKGLAAALFGFALPLLTLILTNDPARAGVVGAIALAVRAATTLAGGVLADRHRRIALMVLGSAIGVVIAGAFTLLALGEALTFASLLAVAVLLAARTGLFDVAGESALKEVVPAGAMGQAQAANQGRDAVLQLAGGPLGGALLAAGGWLVGAVMTLCHLIATVTAWMLSRSAGPAAAPTPSTATPTATPTPTGTGTGTDTDSGTATATDRREPATPPPAPNAFAEMRAGFAWLLSRPDLRGVLLVSTLINLGFNAALATVIYALQQDGTSPAAIGWVSAGAGVAMLLGAVAAPMLVSRVPAGVLTIVGLAVAAAGALALTLVDSVWAITGVLALAVLAVPALNAALMGYFMVATPSELLGRANSASMVLGIGAMPLGPLIAGFGLTWIGRTGTITICAALCVVAALLALANRGLRALPVESGWTAHAARF